MMQFPKLFVLSVIIFFCLPIYFSLSVLSLLFCFQPWRQKIVIIFFSLLFLCFQTLFLRTKILPDSLNNKPILIRAIVINTISKNGRYNQLTVRALSCGNDKQTCSYRLLLNDYDQKHALSEGDVLTVLVKLRQFSNYRDPGSQDFIALQRAKKLSGQGYIKSIISVETSLPSFICLMRQSFKQEVLKLFSEPFNRALMASLLLGDRSELTAKDYELFQLTGTSHLIAISGLHVGLIAAVSFYLSSFLWRRFPTLCQWVAAHRVGALMGIITALFYAELSGFSTSTQRAFIMSFVFLSAKLLNKRTSVWHSFILAMALVLLANPFSVFLPGFYLSFLAVLVLICFGERGFIGVIKTQLSIWLLMMPIGFYFFHYYSLLSIPANLIAIPLVSFIILPLGFLAVFIRGTSEILSQIIASIISSTIHVLMIFLKKLITIKMFSMFFSINAISVLLLVTAILFWFLKQPSIKRGLLSFSIIVLCVFPYQQTLKVKQADIFVLDVGQGLAVVIKTKNHTLLYDTGAKYGSGFNLGDAVVVPFLFSKGIYHLDAMIISHEDMNHRGGFEAILKKVRVDKIYRNGKHGFTNCHHAKSWTWDEVEFRFLSIVNNEKLSSNNQSCILRIDNGIKRALLTGDIEKWAENKLIEKFSKSLRANFLLSPHHGSKTSSSIEFLKAVSPTDIVISAGRHSRYRLPHQTILKRYQQLGISVQNTAKSGMIHYQVYR